MPCDWRRPAPVMWANFMLQSSGGHERACALMQPYRTQAHGLNINDLSLAQSHVLRPLWLLQWTAALMTGAQWKASRLGDSFFTRRFFSAQVQGLGRQKKLRQPFYSAPAAASLSRFHQSAFLFFFFLYPARQSLQGQKIMSCSGATVALCSCNYGILGIAPCHITITMLLNNDRSFINYWFKHTLP